MEFLTRLSTYDLILLLLGLSFFAIAVLPGFLKRTVLSMPMLLVGIGMASAWIYPSPVRFDPIEHGALVERLSELAVIVALMSVGLQLDRPLGWRSWMTTWRLLAVTMPLSIAAMAIGGVWFAGLPVAAAVLLGAAIAPTDPVLASSVQVGPPKQEGVESEPRFALTSEAGLNDGLAFPFVNLAIVLAATGFAREGLMHWAGVDVVWKIAVALAAGAFIGYTIAIIVFRFCAPGAVVDGFVALALTLIAYGATELVHGYGFIAVFVAAVVFRRQERHNEYHKALHWFSEQTEQLLMAVLLILFGAAIAHGLFEALTWPAAILGIVFLTLLRPAAGMLGLLGMSLPLVQRAAIAMFGIRGIGTFYYLSHGLNEADIGESEARMLWAIAGFVVLVSVIGHGMTAPVAMRRVT